MKLAIKIIKAEIAQRELANSHKGNLRAEQTQDELKSLCKALELIESAEYKSQISEAEINIEPCDHPASKRMGWHDSAILRRGCNCIIEQYGEAIIPPNKI